MVTTVRHKVNFYDTDAMSVVHHSNYIRWFEIGRVEFLREAGITLNQLMDDGFVFPITEVSAKYVNSAKFDDELIIETTPEALTKAKMAFTYRILRASDDTMLVSGRTQNVFTSMETGKITRLPDAYYNKLKAMLD